VFERDHATKGQAVMARRHSNTLAAAVLAVLWEGPTHPYAVQRTLRERGLDRSIKLSRGTVYLLFGQLTRDGHVEAVATGRTANRPTHTVFTLTEPGRAQLLDWAKELLSVPSTEHGAFPTGLRLLPVLAPAEAATLLRERCAALAAEISAVGAEPGHPLVDEYRRAQLELEQDFVDRLIARIEHQPADSGRRHTRTAAARGRSHQLEES
jgi:DNA-binding PadR family transcriptional regulator